MRLTDIEFENEFENLNQIYEMRNPHRIHEFIKQNEDLIILLHETKPYLTNKFPNGKFELQAHDDITGEGNHKLYINVFVDDETFNNSFMNDLHEIHGKITPLEKELNLMTKLILMPGVEGY